VIKKSLFGDPTTVRKTVYYFSELYSIGITRDDVDSLFAAARIEAEAKKFRRTRLSSSRVRWSVRRSAPLGDLRSLFKAR
jgi:hypothetical protein